MRSPLRWLSPGSLMCFAVLSFLVAPLAHAFPVALPTDQVLELAVAQTSADEAGPSGFGFDAQDIAGELILAVILAVAGVLVRRTQMDQARRQMILTFGDIAYGVVHEVSRRTANKIDDKAALGLRHVLDLLQAHGQPPLTPAESMTVRALFDARHGNEAKAAERAQLAAPKVSNVLIGGQGEARPQMPPA